MSKPDDLSDGVYFGLDETTYHALPRLSASGIKTMMTSVEDYWHDSWMNPLRTRQESDAMTLGTAYHKRILEGAEAFCATHCARLEKEDHPDALVTMDDIRARLKDMGLKVGGTKADLVDRLTEADPAVVVWDALVADHAARNDGKVMLASEQIQRIEYAAAFIEKHPDLGRAFFGGQPEVTVLWTEAESGVPMKARFDYLKVKAVIDLKTFSNPLGKPIEGAIYGAMAAGRYHVQAAVYLDAIEYARSLYAEGAIHGDHDPEWLGKCMRTKEHKFMFVFQKSVGAPVARPFILPRRLTLDAGKVYVRDCIEMWRRFMDTYGDDGTPWIDLEAMEVQEFEDELVPKYAFG